MDLDRSAEPASTSGEGPAPPGAPDGPLPGGAGADAKVAPSPRAANLALETGLQPGGRERETGDPEDSGHREAHSSTEMID
eukprot:5929715-Pyramimonas_sp.AAC.1